MKTKDYLRNNGLDIGAIAERNAANKYRGVVTDRLGTLPTRKTRWTSTWEDASDRAETLCRATYGERGRIDVVVR